MPVVSKTLNGGDSFTFFIDTDAAKYTFKCGGTADVVVGVYKTDQKVPTPDSSCRIVGVAKWGCRQLVAGKHLVTVTANAAGTFTFDFANYSYWDEIGLRFTHKSG